MRWRSWPSSRPARAVEAGISAGRLYSRRDLVPRMGEGDVDLVRRIYGFDWAAVGSRRMGFDELMELVTDDFTSQPSPELRGRAVAAYRAQETAKREAGL